MRAIATGLASVAVLALAGSLAHADPYPAGPPQTLAFDPGDPGARKHVIKGGSFLCSPNYCYRYRPAAREPGPSDTGENHIGFRTVLLIRDPVEVVASYVRARQHCEPDDIGLPQQGWLLDLWDRHDLDVPIIDAGDFLRAPEAPLRRLCDWLDIPFTDRMLSWPPGPRASDGVWAPHWYAAVWSSTGFEPYRPRDTSLSDHDAAVAEACRPIYEALYARRVRV